jgi:hypothetical protein
MFRRPTLSAANLCAALAYAAFFATIFQASLFMQQVLGYSALRTGVAYLAIATTALLTAAGLAPRLLFNTEETPMNMTENAARLRSLHRRGDPLVLVNAWDVASAGRVVAAGGRAVATLAAVDRLAAELLTA